MELGLKNLVLILAVAALSSCASQEFKIGVGLTGPAPSSAIGSGHTAPFSQSCYKSSDCASGFTCSDTRVCFGPVVYVNPATAH